LKLFRDFRQSPLTVLTWIFFLGVLLLALFFSLEANAGEPAVPVLRPTFDQKVVALLKPHRIYPQAVIGAGEAAHVTEGPDYAGQHAQMDMPGTMHMRNTVGRDRQGLCVTTSLEVCDRANGDGGLRGLQKHMTQFGGGSTPQRITRDLPAYDHDIEFVQVQGGPDEIRRALDLAFRTGRCVGMTYGYGERYHNQTIAHMVSGAAWGQRYGAIVDNNFPGSFEWMSCEELVKRCCWPHGTGWLVILLGPPPPPPLRVAG
jgi:hypothetical protein